MVFSMSNKRILFMMGEGVGNVIETIPAVRTLNEALGYDVDFWHSFGHYGIPHIIPYADRWIVGQKIGSISPFEYVGKVSTFWTRAHVNRGPLAQIPLLAMSEKVCRDRSEVDTYMDIPRQLGVKEEDILWHGECNYNRLKKAKNYYDIAIHDGYNKHGVAIDGWNAKSYPYYKEVVSLLNEFRICSLGSRDEYVVGTDDKTGLDLLTSLGIIKNCKLFLSNDSGLYHCANALCIPNIVIFTYTSTLKNYDKRFHKYSTIIRRDDLECIGCQNTPHFKTCTTRECRNIDPEVIVNVIREMLNG